MFEQWAVGNVITVVVLVAGFIVSWTTTRVTVNNIGKRLIQVEGELKRLVDVLIEQGRHDERMNAMDARIAAHGQRLDELTARYNRQRNGTVVPD